MAFSSPGHSRAEWTRWQSDDDVPHVCTCSARSAGAFDMMESHNGAMQIILNCELLMYLGAVNDDLSDVIVPRFIDGRTTLDAMLRTYAHKYREL